MRKSKEVTVRIVNEFDIKDLWIWWNDPHNLKMMYNNEPSNWENHCRWFRNTILTKKRIQYIGIYNGQKIGAVWFDHVVDNVYEVGITMNKLFRGKRLAGEVLQQSIHVFCNNYKTSLLVASGKKINIPCNKTFLSCGFINAIPSEKINNNRQKLDMKYYWYVEYKVNH